MLILNEKVCELSGGFKRTTNNRMELLAAITALEAIKAPCEVTLHSDSRYLVDAMTKGWLRGWKSRGWWRQPCRQRRGAGVIDSVWPISCLRSRELGFLDA